MRWILVVFVLVTIGCGAGYIVQVNGATAKGFAMRELERRAVALRAQNDKMESEVAELMSMDTVVEKIKMLGMEEMGKPEYLTGLSAVAVAK